MNKKYKMVYLIIVLIIICIVMFYKKFYKNEYIEDVFDLETSTLNTETNDDDAKIIIHVAGAVKNEGIYEMKANSRISDCIKEAGGLTEDADISNINLAQVAEDGEKIDIPKKGEKNEEIQNVNALNENKDTKAADKKININTANQAELETLPGIGPSTATKILEYRSENGKFTKIEDLKKVKGIGDGKDLKIKDLIKI